MLLDPSDRDRRSKLVTLEQLAASVDRATDVEPVSAGVLCKTPAPCLASVSSTRTPHAGSMMSGTMSVTDHARKI